MQKIDKDFFKEGQDYSNEFLASINQCVTHFHAVDFCRNKLTSNGFTELKEVDSWALKGGESYFFTRNNSTIVAFTLGNKVPDQGVEMFKIIGCHTDSPVFKLAPVTKMNDKFGFQQIAVQTYGGGLWHTWFDRDLTLAGRILVSEGGVLKSKLWHAKDSLLKIPNLAIHLTDRAGKFEPSKETHTKPIMASAIID